MFAKDIDSSIKFFDDGKRMPVVPVEVKIPEMMVPPLAVVGPKSGAYLIAQYCQALRFCLQDHQEMTEAAIDQAFYDNVQKTSGYIKFSDGVQAASQYIGGDAIYFQTIPFLKRFLHRYSLCLVELQPDTAICSASASNLAGMFNCPTLSGTMFDENLTKGFIACGYDSDGVLLQNNLGQSFGNKGFMKMSWTQLNQLFIKGACLKNIH